MESLANQAQALKNRFLFLVDEDTASFNQVMTAMRMPKDSEEEQALRAEALQSATIYSAEIPLQVMQASLEAMKLAKRISEIGNQNSLSDAGVAILQAHAGLEGAAMNVLINVPGIDDANQVETFKSAVASLRKEARMLTDKALDQIFNTLSTAEG